MAKLRNKRTNEKYEIALDERGQVVDLENWLLEERRTEEERYGRMAPDLYERLETAGPDELIPVGIWLVAERDALPRPLPGESPDSPEFKSRRAAAEQERKEAIRLATDPLVNELTNKGRSVRYVDTFVPVIYADLTKADILDLARRPEVENLFLEGINQPE